MYCTRCGTTVPDGAGFCTSCGTPMSADQPAAPPPPPVYQAPPPPPVYQAPAQPVYQAQQPVYQAPPVYQTPTPPEGQNYPATHQTQPVLVALTLYAGFWKRVGAYLIDSLILGIAYLVIAAIVFFAIGGGALISGSETPQDFFAALTGVAIAMVIFAYLALFVILWLYFAKMESGEKQATIGKKALGIYVTDLNGQRLSFGRATGRFFSKAFITGIIPFGIGFMMAGFTAKRQALHDMIAGTLVWRR